MLAQGVLRMRPVEEADLALFQEWQTLETQGLFQDFHFRSSVCLRRQFEADGFCSETQQMLIIEGKNLGPLGALYLNQVRPGVFRISLLLSDEEHRGQGVGTTAIDMAVEYLFDNYPVERVDAEVDLENEAGQSLLEEAGFRREAVLQSWRFHHGQWRDYVVFRRLRTEVLDPGALVQEFWDHFSQQRYEDLNKVLHEDVEVLWPNTKERFSGRDAFVAVNREYPGSWQADLEVLEICGDRVLTVARVYDGSTSVHVNSWFRCAGGRIVQITEYFSEDGEPPTWRSAMKVSAPWVDAK